jgi:hypothetical protein
LLFVEIVAGMQFEGAKMEFVGFGGRHRLGRLIDHCRG